MWRKGEEIYGKWAYSLHSFTGCNIKYCRNFFFDLLFLVLFSGVMAISFFGAMLNNIFHPLEDTLSIWYVSKITSSVFIKFLLIFIIFCVILFFLMGDVAIFFLFISYVFAGINFGLYTMARLRIKIHTPE